MCHLIMVPQDADGLRRAISETHRRFTRRINLREGWQGHLWQERFHSFLLDETHLLAAARYVENNPVRAGLCAHAEDWPWSSVRAHLRGEDDGLARVAPLLAMVGNWPEYLGAAVKQSLVNKIHAHARTGQPLGEEAFVEELEGRLNRRLRPQKRGPRPRRLTTRRSFHRLGDAGGEFCILSPKVLRAARMSALPGWRWSARRRSARASLCLPALCRAIAST